MAAIARKSRRPGTAKTAAGTPARWRRRKEARPQEILEAALGVFAEKGFAAAKLEDIAARAGVTKGTIYLYFNSKEAVFKALIQEKLVRRISGFADQARAHKGPAAPFLAQLLRSIGTMLRTSDYAVLPKIVIAEAGNCPDLARMYRQEVIARGFKLFGGIIEAGIARGEFKTIPVPHAIRLALGPILLAAIWRTTFAKYDEVPYDYDGLIEAHIATLMHGLAKESTS